MTADDAIRILDMFLHKQCDLERTKFAHTENEVWNAVCMARDALESKINHKEDNEMSKTLDMARESVRIPEEQENQEAKENQSTPGKTLLGDLLPGEVFKIGEHDFIVLEHLPDMAGTAVISKDLLIKNVEFGTSRDYKTSNVRKRIDAEIVPMIEAALGDDSMIQHTVDLTSVDMQSEFGAIECKTHPLTFDLARKYNDLLVNEDLGDCYWTCTPWSTADRGWEYSMSIVCSSGDFFDGCCSSRIGVRPFCILKSNIFASKGE